MVRDFKAALPDATVDGTPESVPMYPYEIATRLRKGEREEVAINSLRPGDVIEVAAGGRLPADGKLLSPFASFDESALTGESIPVERATGDKVPAGATSVDRLVTLEVLSDRKSVV